VDAHTKAYAPSERRQIPMRGDIHDMAEFPAE
jgi:hypothetical protein